MNKLVIAVATTIMITAVLFYGGMVFIVIPAFLAGWKWKDVWDNYAVEVRSSIRGHFKGR